MIRERFELSTFRDQQCEANVITNYTIQPFFIAVLPKCLNNIVFYLGSSRIKLFRR